MVSLLKAVENRSNLNDRFVETLDNGSTHGGIERLRASLFL